MNPSAIFVLGYVDVGVADRRHLAHHPVRRRELHFPPERIARPALMPLALGDTASEDCSSDMRNGS